MKVAVIIVNYNDVANTNRFVNQITKYEVINRIVVVDNKSTAIGAFENLKKLESNKVKVLQADKNGGYDYGNNFGVKYLQSQNEEYDYIIISNSDIEIEEKAIMRCLDVLEANTNVAICAPRMFNKDDKPIRRSSWKIRTFWLDVVHATRLLEILFYKVLRNGEYSEEEYKNEILKVEAISGAFFIIRYDVLKNIGLLDENVFLFYEEDILAQKIKQKGLDIISLNSEKFIHFESQAIGKTLSYYKKMRQLYISKMYYHKYYNKINLAGEIIYGILNICRKIELFVEIPVRKLLKK